jgi:hypothetical protein
MPSRVRWRKFADLHFPLRSTRSSTAVRLTSRPEFEAVRTTYEMATGYGSDRNFAAVRSCAGGFFESRENRVEKDHKARSVRSPADLRPHAMIKNGWPKMIRMASEVASNCLVRTEIRNRGEAELAHPFHQPRWFEKAAHWFTARRRDCHDRR